MEKQAVDKLIACMQSHPGMIVLDRPLFTDILLATYVPRSSTFYETFSDDLKQTVTGDNQYVNFSLRRVLRNYNAAHVDAGFRGFYRSILSGMAKYSSTALAENISADNDLIELMAQSAQAGNEFSLLGKMETYDYSNPEEILFIERRPVLVIPDVQDMGAMMDWEQKNTRYEKEVGLPFLKHTRRIRADEFLAHCS